MQTDNTGALDCRSINESLRESINDIYMCGMRNWFESWPIQYPVQREETSLAFFFENGQGCSISWPREIDSDCEVLQISGFQYCVKLRLVIYIILETYIRVQFENALDQILTDVASIRKPKSCSQKRSQRGILVHKMWVNVLLSQNWD